MWRYSDCLRLLIVAASVSLVFSPSSAAAQDAPKGPRDSKMSLAKAEVTEQDDAEIRLLKERYNAAVDEWTSMFQLREFGQITVADPQLLSAMQRAVSSGLELHQRPADRIQLLEQYVKIATAADEATTVAGTSGRIGSQERHRARYYRLDAELQLLRETRRTK